MNTTSPTCPDPGMWRAWLDHESQLSSLDDHLPGCPACRRLVTDLREEAAVVREAFSLLAPIRLPSEAETAMARERLDLLRRRPVAIPAQAYPHPQEPIPMFFSRISTSWRVAATGVAAVLAISVLVAFTPQGNAAAAGFLAQFRSQQVTAFEVTPQTQADIIKTMSALNNLGTLQTPANLGRLGGADAAVTPVQRGAASEQQPRTVSLSEASQTVGFALQTPDPATLPAGVDRTPSIQVMPASQIRFTFDKNKARTYYESTGHPEVTLPDKFDGATLAVSIPSAAMLRYGGANSTSKDALIIGEAGELVVDVEGGKVSLLEMRDFLLGLPGLPPAVVNQLKQVQNWNSTLPIPIPVDKVNWQSTSFNGNQGLLLNDNSGVGSAAIWHANGHLFGIAGSLRATDLKRIADSLGTAH